MSRIPCIKRTKSLHNVPRPTYISRGRRPINNICPQGTPPIFREGFQGQQRQYAPNEFGLSPNEQFQDAQQFFNMPENQCQQQPAQGTPPIFREGFQGPQRQYAANDFGLSPNEQFQDAQQFFNMPENQCQQQPAQGTPPIFREEFQGPQRQYAANDFGLSPNEQFQDAQQFFNMPENQCQQPAAQYSPSEFGISPDEQFQNAEIFRNLDFNTNRAALEQLRGPVRPTYQPRAPQLSGLPNECLDEISFPSFKSPPKRSPGSRYRNIVQQVGSACIDDVSEPNFVGNLSSPQPDECIADAPAPSQQLVRLDDAECVNNEQPEESEISSLYTGVLQRFEALKRRLAAEREERARQQIGQQASPQNDCISGAGRTTETQIDTKGGEIVKETVVEKSVIENGELQKCTKHIITRRDACGNETSECNECKERIAPEQGIEPAIDDQRISDHQQAPSCGDPFMLRLACNVRRRLDFTIPEEITKDPCPPCEEQLADESAPLLVSNLPSSRRSLSLPSQQLGDISAPSFGHLPSPVSPQRLEDLSAPDLQMGSPISPLRHFRKMPSLPSQQLIDMSAPSFARSMQSTAPEECAPSPARSKSMRSSPQRHSPPCEQICDMPAHAPSPAPARSPSVRVSTPSPVQQECLDNATPPSLARSMSSSPQRRSLPCNPLPAPSPVQSPSLRYSLPPLEPDCLDDESAPPFARSMSMRSSPRARSLPSAKVYDMSLPTFGSSLPSSIRPEHLEDISAPSFERLPSPVRPQCLEDESAPDLQMGSPISPLSRFRRMPSLPSQQLIDMSAPSFARSMQSTAPEECAPSPLNRFRRIPSLPSQQLIDMSAPSFARSMQSTAQEECAPSPARSMSMRSSPQRRSPPCEQICDMPAHAPSPAPARSPSVRGSMPSPVQPECLDNVTVTPPSFARSRSSSPQRRSLPCDQMPALSPAQSSSLRYSLPPLEPDCLDDESAPPFARSMSMRSSPRVRSLPSQQLADISAPSFERLPSPVRPQCLEDESAPDLQMGSPISPLSRFRRMPSLPSQQLIDMSAPSFARSMQSTAPEECAPSPLNRFRRIPSLPSQQLIDMSAPSFARSMQSTAQEECAPSPARSMSMRSSPQRRSPPCEQICDMPAHAPSPAPARSPSVRGSMPSPVQPECLDNVTVTPPSFARSRSSSPQRRSLPCDQMPALSPAQSSSLRYSLPPLEPDCLDDESAPPFARSMSMRSSPRVRSLPSQQLADISAPSFERLPSPVRPQCLEDESAPDLQMGSPISPLSRFRRMPSLPSQQLIDMSAPSFARSMQSTAPEECAPSPVSRFRRIPSLPSQQLIDMSAPSFARSMQSTAPEEYAPSPARSMSMRSSPQRRSPPCEQICDMPAYAPLPAPARSPSVRGSMPLPVQQECLGNFTVTPPSFARSRSSSPQRRSLPCDQMPAPSPAQSPSLRYSLPPLEPDCLDDESAPPFARSMSMRSSPRVRSLPSQQLADISAPSFERLPSPVRPQCLEDESAPDLQMGSPISPLSRFRRMPSLPSQQLIDMSAPSFARSMQSTAPEECAPSPVSRFRRIPSLPSQQLIDMSAPSFARSMPSSVAPECPSSLNYAQYGDVSLPPQFTPQGRADCNIDALTSRSSGANNIRSTASTPCGSFRDRSLPSMFSSAGRINSRDVANYVQYADDSVPSMFNSPIRRTPNFAALPICNVASPGQGGRPSPAMASPMRSPRRSRSLPRERICDVSPPFPARSMSLRSSPRERSLPSAQIYDMSLPTFGRSLPSSIRPECLEDISAPSFERLPSPVRPQYLEDVSAPDLQMGSPISPLSRFRRMPSLPSQQLIDMSAPSFARSMQSTAPEECAPSPVSRFRRIPSLPSQQLIDMSAPSFARSMQSTAPEEYAPSPAPARSPSVRGSMPSPVQQECLDNVTVTPPSFARSMSSSPQRRSLPCDQMPAPSPAQSSSLRYSLPPLEPDCLDDESAPPFARSMSMRSSPRVRSLPSQQLADISAPSFERLPSPVRPQCLEDESAPDLQMGSPISPLRRRMPSLPSQQLCNVSEPSYKSYEASPVALEHPSTPSYAQYANVPLPPQERSLPSMFSSQGGSPGNDRWANYADVSLPSTFDSPIRQPRAQIGPEKFNLNEYQFGGSAPPPDNSYKETIQISASVHSIATLTIEDNRNISPANQSSPRGFEGMANYMPFDQQMQGSPLARRMPNFNATNPFDDSYYDDECL